MDDQIDDVAVTRARKRVEEVRGFYVHLAIYLVVCSGLMLIDYLQNDALVWSYWVVIGWGIGIAAHAVAVLVESSVFSSNWEARKLAKYTEQERRRLHGT